MTSVADTSVKKSIVVNEVKWCTVDLLSIALTWGLVVGYAWRSGDGGGALLIGSVFMVYQYAQQAGGVLCSIASNLQGFARARTDYASADAIWNAPQARDRGAAVDPHWQRIDAVDLVYERSVVAQSEAGAGKSPGLRRATDAIVVVPGGEERAGGVRHVSLGLARGERIALVGRGRELQSDGCGQQPRTPSLYSQYGSPYSVRSIARRGVRARTCRLCRPAG